MKKAIATALAVLGLAIGPAAVAQAANGVPDVTDKSISAARRAIADAGDRMTITLLNPINGCDRDERIAVDQRATYFRATDRSIVNVKFDCP